MKYAYKSGYYDYEVWCYDHNREEFRGLYVLAYWLGYAAARRRRLINFGWMR